MLMTVFIKDLSLSLEVSAQLARHRVKFVVPLTIVTFSLKLFSLTLRVVYSTGHIIQIQTACNSKVRENT